MENSWDFEMWEVKNDPWWRWSLICSWWPRIEEVMQRNWVLRTCFAHYHQYTIMLGLFWSAFVRFRMVPMLYNYTQRWPLLHFSKARDFSLLILISGLLNLVFCEELEIASTGNESSKAHKSLGSWLKVKDNTDSLGICICSLCIYTDV